jgi:hypothetical protein
MVQWYGAFRRNSTDHNDQKDFPKELPGRSRKADLLEPPGISPLPGKIRSEC